MTIDETINHIKYGIIENNYPLQRDLGIEACNLAIETMRKYQKIEEIITDWKNDGGAFEMSESYWLRLISEVIEDEKVLIDISDGMLELTLYKFKRWLGSVPREVQNRQLKHTPYKGE